MYARRIYASRAGCSWVSVARCTLRSVTADGAACSRPTLTCRPRAHTAWPFCVPHACSQRLCDRQHHRDRRGCSGVLPASKLLLVLLPLQPQSQRKVRFIVGPARGPALGHVSRGGRPRRCSAHPFACRRGAVSFLRQSLGGALCLPFVGPGRWGLPPALTRHVHGHGVCADLIPPFRNFLQRTDRKLELKRNQRMEKNVQKRTDREARLNETRAKYKLETLNSQVHVCACVCGACVRVCVCVGLSCSDQEMPAMSCTRQFAPPLHPRECPAHANHAYHCPLLVARLVWGGYSSSSTTEQHQLVGAGATGDGPRPSLPIITSNFSPYCGESTKRFVLIPPPTTVVLCRNQGTSPGLPHFYFSPGRTSLGERATAPVVCHVGLCSCLGQRAVAPVVCHVGLCSCLGTHTS